MRKNQTKALLKKIHDSKELISKERDKLRADFEELDSLLRSPDDGIENLEEGIRFIEDGIDDLSLYL